MFELKMNTTAIDHDATICEARQLAEQTDHPELARALSRVRRVLRTLPVRCEECGAGMYPETDNETGE
jgi:hypothetical protein